MRKVRSQREFVSFGFVPGGTNWAFTPNVIGAVPDSWTPMSGALPVKTSQKLGITTALSYPGLRRAS